jgi:hypothetical protein
MKKTEILNTTQQPDKQEINSNKKMLKSRI